MRLFIAVNFSAETLGVLRAARDELRRLADGRGSFTPDANLHLTLAFLGEVPEERAAPAAEALREAGTRPFELVFDRAGRFRREGGDIWWAGGPENPALLALRRRLARALAERGFALEERRFTPHVTLARRVGPLPERPALFAQPQVERVERISLMRSELRYSPPRYTVLASG